MSDLREAVMYIYERGATKRYRGEIITYNDPEFVDTVKRIESMFAPKWKSFSGRTVQKLDKDHISIAGRVIRFGMTKPPFDWVRVQYDSDKKMIKFSDGKHQFRSVSYKLSSNTNSGSYSISPRGLIENGILPRGLYEKVGENEYRFINSNPKLESTN